MEMTAEQMCALNELAKVIAENNRKEAEAVEGYTEQLKAIAKVRSLFSDTDVVGALDELEAETREKIADELSHSRSLNEEYTELTGIEPKED